MRTMDSVSRTAGSSSTTKISPRERAFSAISYRPCVVNHDAYSGDRIQLHIRSKRTSICTGRSLNAQVATRTLDIRRRSVPMQNAAGDGITLGPDRQNDSYRTVVSHLVGLIEHVQASLRLVEQTMVRES